MKIPFLKLAPFFVSLSLVLTIVSVGFLLYKGPKMSIEFTGGTLMELQLPEGATSAKLKEVLESTTLTPPVGNVQISTTAEGAAFLRMRTLENEEHLAVLAKLQEELPGIDERRFTSIGPTVGENLKSRSLWALFAACIGIIVYIAFAFRNVPRSLSPWKFGVLAVVTLMHDVLLTAGIFAVLSYYTNFQADTLFITALLTILGYSVNDTIVIFDRVRENASLAEKRESFAHTAEHSLQQTWRRSCTTSIAALIMLFSLLVIGPESIRWFTLTLIVGIVLGTYSSIFLATPLLVYWRRKA